MDWLGKVMHQQQGKDSEVERLGVSQCAGVHVFIMEGGGANPLDEGLYFQYDSETEGDVRCRHPSGHASLTHQSSITGLMKCSVCVFVTLGMKCGVTLSRFNSRIWGIECQCNVLVANELIW